MTERQEHIVREIGLELTRQKQSAKSQHSQIIFTGAGTEMRLIRRTASHKAQPNTRVTRC